MRSDARQRWFYFSVPVVVRAIGIGRVTQSDLDNRVKPFRAEFSLRAVWAMSSNWLQVDQRLFHRSSEIISALWRNWLRNVQHASRRLGE